LDNLDEINKFLETQNLLKLNHREIEKLNTLLPSKEIESVIKNLTTKKSPGSDGFSGDFYQTFEDGLAILLKLFQKLEEKELFPNILQGQHYNDTKTKDTTKK